MQIGVVGLGRMGAKITRRLMRAGRRCVVFDANVTVREALVKDGAADAGSLAALVTMLRETPRSVGGMLPAGPITGAAVARLRSLLEADAVGRSAAK
jgi:6-phosphogluconate dehydrogenase